MIKLVNSIELLKITQKQYLQIPIMHIPIIIKELVLIEKETMIKLSYAFQKQYRLNQKKLTSFIIEDLLIGKKKNLTMLLKIIKMQLLQILNISRHITIEHFAGINQENWNNQKLIIKVQLIFNLKIYQLFIIQGQSEKKLEEKNQIKQCKILMKS